MKIVNLQQFLSLPENVLYAKFDGETFSFREISIKGKTLTSDWWYQDLLEVSGNSSDEIDNTLSDAVEKGTSFSLDLDCVSRDGLYEDKQLFAVFEKEDVVSLITRFEKTITNYPKI